LLLFQLLLLLFQLLPPRLLLLLLLLLHLFAPLICSSPRFSSTRATITVTAADCSTANFAVLGPPPLLPLFQELLLLLPLLLCQQLLLLLYLLAPLICSSPRLSSRLSALRNTRLALCAMVLATSRAACRMRLKHQQQHLEQV
jgi:hypothetical protein